MKNVCALVVTYNRLNLLKECINSIRKQTYREFDILVVNNGSTDGTEEWLADQGDVIVINQFNSGGAGGFFTGMKHIAKEGYKYCWLMDDDVECNPDALSILIDAANTSPNFGFICSRVLGLKNNLMNVPTVDSRKKNGQYPTYLDRIDSKMIKVRSATFVSLLIPTDKIKECGLPYKHFFIWGDDTEYTKRLSNSYDCYLAFESIVIHKRAQNNRLDLITETDPDRINMYFYLYRNNYIVCKKNGNTRKIVHYVLNEIWLLLFFLVRVDLKKAKVMAKAICAQFTFFPRIEYPE